MRDAFSTETADPTNDPARHVWLDGRLRPAGEPHLSVYDRGFQLGDGIFEALRARRGVGIELDGHLARLHESARTLAIDLPFTDAEIAAGISDLLAADGFAGDGSDPRDAVLRITVSRGFDPTRNIPPAGGARATVAIQVWPWQPPSRRVLEDGERLVTSAIHRDPASPMSAAKTTARAELVFARLEAERAGGDDALFLTTDGRVTEATTSNVLVIHGSTCATPRLGTGLLAGTTRAWLVAHGESVGLQMVERDLRLDDLFAADEVALCASIGGVIPVTLVDGRRIGDGRPGPRTMALRAARERWIDELSLSGAAARVGAPAEAGGDR